MPEPVDPSERAVETWTVPTELDGNRLDLVLARLAGLSRTNARALCDEGRVQVSGRQGSAKQRVGAGEQVTAAMADGEEQTLPSAAVEFAVAYEDPSFLVIDKPPGLVVHPGAGHRSDTLANGLIARYPELGALEGEHRWGIVHRLDRDTSGLMLVARTDAVHRALQRSLKRREIARTYLALVDGKLPAATGTIDAPVARDAVRPTRMAVRRLGKPARTHYRVLAVWPSAQLSLVEVTLETGRTHQIRVHFSSIGHPLAGDRSYGYRRENDGRPPRVWLHASKLEFDHPVSGEPVAVTAPLPADLEAHLARLGPPASGREPW